MTRINTIPVSELERQHLIAEYREIGRIFDVACKAELRGYTPESYKIPAEFCLGAGHVKFFTDKLIFIEKRFTDLVNEMINRGYKPKFTSLSSKARPKNPGWYNDWQPTIQSQTLIRSRIAERLSK